MRDTFVSIVKLICVVYLVILAPKLVSVYSSFSRRHPDNRLQVLLGVENLAYSRQNYKQLKKLRFGMVCGLTSVDQLGYHSVDLLRDHGFCIRKIFELKDYSKAVNKKRNSNHIPCYQLQKLSDKSLYNHSKKLDALLIDIQSTGISCDPAMKVLYRLLQFSSRYKKKLIILDRPNPLGGIIEGPGVVPWRHGLTIGEMAHYYNRTIVKKPVDVRVIPLKQWWRGRQTGISFERNYQHASLFQPISYIKPIHLHNTDNGLSHAFLFSSKEKLSLWETRYLKRICWKMGLHCFDYSCQTKKNGMLRGVKLCIKSDINKVSFFNSLLTIARFLKNRKQIKLSFKDQIDDIFGSNSVRRFLEQKISFDVLKDGVVKSISAFYDKSKGCCIYKPFPVVVKPELVRR